QIVNTPNSIIFRKTQQKNDQGEIDGSQFDLTILFLSDLPNTIEPNFDIQKYISLRLKNSKYSNFYLTPSRKKRNINNHSGRRTNIIELFSIEISENTSHTISRHKSFGRYYAYAKSTDDYKREALANIFNKIITTLSPSSTEAFQDSINDSDFEVDDYEDLQNNISEDDNNISA
ncbi:6834_t:CDS:2, partial [Racocetra persica]